MAEWAAPTGLETHGVQAQGVALGWYEAAPLALVVVAFGFFMVCLDLP